MANITVKKGDTLSAIAKRAGMSVQSLIAQNPQFTNPNLIRPGETVSVSGKESGKRARQAAANLMMASPLPTDPNFASFYNQAGQLIADASGQGIGRLSALTPQIAQQQGAPAIAGLSPAQQRTAGPEYLQARMQDQRAAIQPQSATPPIWAGEAYPGFLEPSIPSARGNVQQVQQQAATVAQQAAAPAQIAQYDTQAIQAGIQLDPESLARRAAVSALARSAPTAGETFEGLFGGVMNYFAQLESRAERERVAELRRQGISSDEARAQAQREFRPTGRASLEQYNEARGGAYYSKGTTPATLPASADGTQAPSPRNTMETVTRSVVLQQNQENDAASRIALSFVDETAKATVPQNILLAFGEEGIPNPSMVRIRDLALQKLAEQFMAINGVAQLTIEQQQILDALSNSPLEEFYGYLGYVPSSSNPNIWTRTGEGGTIPTTPEGVAASILQGGGYAGSFYDASRVPSPGRGSARGASNSRASNWATQSAGLYLWRISA